MSQEAVEELLLKGWCFKCVSQAALSPVCTGVGGARIGNVFTICRSLSKMPIFFKRMFLTISHSEIQQVAALTSFTACHKR